MVYANTHFTYLAKLIKLNNKLLRILQNQPRCCYVNDLYVTFNTLSQPDLRDRQLLILVHKTLFHGNLLPDIFSITSVLTVQFMVTLHLISLIYT